LRRNKNKPYWLIKEDKRDKEEWHRKYRRIHRKFHIKYCDLLFGKALNNVHRPYYGIYKQFDDFMEAMKEAIRDFPEFFK